MSSNNETQNVSASCDTTPCDTVRAEHDVAVTSDIIYVQYDNETLTLSRQSVLNIEIYTAFMSVFLIDPSCKRTTKFVAASNGCCDIYTVDISHDMMCGIVRFLTYGEINGHGDVTANELYDQLRVWKLLPINVDDGKRIPSAITLELAVGIQEKAWICDHYYKRGFEYLHEEKNLGTITLDDKMYSSMEMLRLSQYGFITTINSWHEATHIDSKIIVGVRDFRRLIVDSGKNILCIKHFRDIGKSNDFINQCRERKSRYIELRNQHDQLYKSHIIRNVSVPSAHRTFECCLIEVLDDARIIMNDLLINQRGQSIVFENFVVAGGKVLSSLQGVCRHEEDIDIFLLCNTDEEAITVICKVIKHFSCSAIERNNNCITIYDNRRVIQIILRLYKSVTEILMGFDMPASMVLYDGNNFITNNCGLSSLKYMSNMFMRECASPSIMFRLTKYAINKSFGILDVDFDWKHVNKSMLKKSANLLGLDLDHPGCNVFVKSDFVNVLREITTSMGMRQSEVRKCMPAVINIFNQATPVSKILLSMRIGHSLSYSISDYSATTDNACMLTCNNMYVTSEKDTDRFKTVDCCRIHGDSSVLVKAMLSIPSRIYGNNFKIPQCIEFMKQMPGAQLSNTFTRSILSDPDSQWYVGPFYRSSKCSNVPLINAIASMNRIAFQIKIGNSYSYKRYTMNKANKMVAQSSRKAAIVNIVDNVM